MINDARPRLACAGTSRTIRRWRSGQIALTSENDNDPDRESPPAGILWFALAFEAGLVLVALALGWLVGIPPFAQTLVDAGDVLTGLVATVPMLMVLWWGLTRPDNAVGRITRQAAQMTRQLFAGATVPGLLLVSMAAGFGEEALFRGVLQPLFANFGGEIAGLVLASVAFGFAHALSRGYAVLAGLIGVYLGVLYLATDNLMTPIVTHTVYDFVALLWLRRAAI